MITELTLLRIWAFLSFAGLIWCLMEIDKKKEKETTLGRLLRGILIISLACLFMWYFMDWIGGLLN